MRVRLKPRVNPMRHFVVTLALVSGLSSTALAVDNSVGAICQRFYSRYFVGYQRLLTAMQQNAAQVDPDLRQFLKTDSGVCRTDGAKAFVKKTSEVLAQHNKKVGVIFGLSDQGREQRNWLYAGMQAFLRNSQLQESDTLVMRDSLPTAAQWEAQLAQLVLVDKVASVIVSLPRGEFERVAKWAQDLSLPMVVLGANRNEKPMNPYVYHVWPYEKHMATVLARYTAERGIKRLGILRPNRNFGASFETFVAAFKQAGIEVTEQQVYNPNDFASIEASMRKMFALERTGRETEFEQAFLKKKQAAEDAGVPVNAHEVLLPPLVRMDAIFIPDNFKAIRHIAKMMKSFSVKQMPLIGTQEWRARNLVDPPEPFLGTSFFADTINSYNNLPMGVSAGVTDSPYFVNPAESFQVDLKIIGYNALQVAIKGKSLTEEKRFKFAMQWKSLQYDAGPYFPKGPIFDPANNAIWPTYLFRIAPKRLDPVPISMASVISKKLGQ